MPISPATRAVIADRERIQDQREILHQALVRIVVECSHVNAIPQPCPVCIAEHALSQVRDA